MFEEELKQHLFDVDFRIYLYSEELIENGVCNDDMYYLLKLCIESNYQVLHDSLLTTNYSIYTEWIKNNMNKNNYYSKWLKKMKNDEDEEHLRRYERIMKRV
jgi:hypothetical protein